jgi:hypothetical protein
VAALFADGLIDYRMVKAIVTRTTLLSDPAALRQLDVLLAGELVGWGPMGVGRTEKTIDGFIAELDPHAVRRSQTRAKGRCFDVRVDDAGGTAEVTATLLAHDGAALDQRIQALADTVCAADPRTRDQRRADAGGAIGFGVDRLPCLCDDPECAAAANPPASGVVVHLVMHDSTPESLTEGATTDNATESISVAEECAGLDGAPKPLFDKSLRELTWAELTAPTPGCFSQLPPAYLTSGMVVPGVIAARAALHARTRPIVHPGQAPPEPRYAPSRALADFIRCRDLTCRFPGCTVPATRCDVDHSVAYPHGPTQAANLKCLCRFHHLVTTFWPGWHDRQLPDGTVVWTDPDGNVHTTTPGSRRLFPSLCAPTAAVEATEAPPVKLTTGLSMPRRRRARAEDRAQRILDEREHNRRAAGAEGEQVAATERAAKAAEARVIIEDPPPF